MEILAVLPLFIAVLCALECCGSAAPINEAQRDLQLPDAQERIKDKIRGSCPRGWTQFQAYCYLVSDEIKSQPDAKQWCSERAGDLVKINSAEENEFVLQLVRQKAPSLQQVWSGLERRGNQFYWSDLSVPVYYSWAAGEPTRQAIETCGHMYVGGHLNELPGRASGSWNDMGCQGNPKYPNGIVCKRLP